MDRVIKSMKAFARILLALYWLAWFGSGVVLAAPGDLDASFGGGKGWVSTGFERGSRFSSLKFRSVLQQTDGKLVLAGSGMYNYDSDSILVRYNPDGSLDTTFDGDGKIIREIRDNNEALTAVIQQADGKLVVAGSNDNRMILIRYNSDGSLDTELNGTGEVTTAVGTQSYAYSVIQQADGKLVVAGDSFNGSNYDITLIRYNSDGTQDVSFDGDGIVTTGIGAQSDRDFSVIQQTDGKLVVAGSSYNGYDWDFALVRYHPDGSLDASFDGDGRLYTPIGRGHDHAYSIIQQSDGKLVVAGNAHNGSNYDVALVRYNTDGSLDTAFDGDGKLTADFNAYDDGAYSLIQQADGKLAVAGYGKNTNNVEDFALLRYNADGSLDITFDGDGKLTTNFEWLADSEVAYSLIQQADGKLVAAGDYLSGHRLARYDVNGSLDTTFSDDGILSTHFRRSIDIGRSVVQQADGKLVVAGTSSDPTLKYFALVRYNANGSLDTTFSDDGKQTTSRNGSVYSMVQQADGKFVLAGVLDSWYDKQIMLQRYNSDGSLDAGFDLDGIRTMKIGDHSVANSVIQQADGKLVLAGDGFNYDDTRDFLLIRFNSSGWLDTTFNGTGKVAFNVGNNTSADPVQAVIQQRDGKLVMLALSRASGSDNLMILRYNANGSLDASFDGDGILLDDIGYGRYVPKSLIQQRDGKLVVAGHTNIFDIHDYDIALVRYNADGSRDTTFDSDGEVMTAIGSSDDYAYSMVQQADGKLVVAGSSKNGSNNDFALVRYNIDGSLDTSFGGDGKLTIAMSANEDIAHSVIQQADGKLVVAGYADNMPTGREFVVVRIESGQLDSDSDGIYNNTDPDDDNDGTPDTTDNCPLAASTNLADADGDGKGDICDNDVDGDGIVNTADNCTWQANADQLNTDGDVSGNACDADDDNDGVNDAQDAFPLDPDESKDSNGNGVGDNADPDDDNDGTSDFGDNCLSIANPNQLDTDGDNLGNVCDAFVNDAALFLQLDGTAKGEQLGASVALADMNGDGMLDLLVGAPQAAVVNDAGQLLKKAGTVRIISGRDNTVLRSMDGWVASQRFGTAIAVIDDVDGDRVPDVLVGDPYADITRPTAAGFSTLKDAGRVSLHSGADGRLLRTVAEGQDAGAQFGAALAVADVNSDSVMDLVVGAPKADSAGKDTGQVIVFSGLADAVLYTRSGTQAGEQFGAAVAATATNLLVGSPMFDTAIAKDAGRVQVFAAANGDNAATFTLDGAAAGDAFGAALAAAGNRWAAGAPGADVAGLKDAGRVQLFDGLTATPLIIRNGDQAGTAFGSALALADFNRDGVPDLVIGAGKRDVGSPLLKDAGRVEVWNAAQ